MAMRCWNHLGETVRFYHAPLLRLQASIQWISTQFFCQPEIPLSALPDARKQRDACIDGARRWGRFQSKKSCGIVHAGRYGAGFEVQVNCGYAIY